MKIEPAQAGRRFAPTALMIGNILTGCSVLAPAGMLSELSSGLGVTIRDAGLLITFGAIVLCVGSPLSAWLTSRIERRTLLTATLGVLALTNAASAFAPDYTTLLVLRLVMLAVGRSTRRRRPAPPRSSCGPRNAAAPSLTFFWDGRLPLRSGCR